MEGENFDEQKDQGEGKCLCCTNQDFYQIIYFGYLIARIIITIIASMYGILVKMNNSNQEILQVANLIIAVTVLYAIYFLIYFQSRLNKMSDETIEKHLKGWSFYEQDDLLKFMIFDYCVIYSVLPLWMMILKYLPDNQNACRKQEVEQGRTDEECDYYVGEYSTQMSITFYIMSMLIFPSLMSHLFFHLFQCPAKIENFDENQIESTKQSSLFALVVFLLYSIAKITLYGYFLNEGKNPNSLILIISNIYFHCIMLLMSIRTFIIIIKDKQNQICKDFSNYMALIQQLFQVDRLNLILLFFATTSLALTGYGCTKHQRIHDLEMFNSNYFITFDCAAMQLFVISSIIISQFIPIFNQMCCPQQAKVQNNETQDCTICLQKMLEGQRMQQLECSKIHKFHTKCLKKWLKRSQKCPICNAQVQVSTYQKLNITINSVIAN